MVGLAELTRQEKAGRIHELDAVRGFALCGIMLVNSWQQPNDAFKGQPDVPVDWVAENLLQSRFYPIFSFLFGVSLVLFLRSTDDDRWALFRRLVVLAGFGVLHTAVNPGEVLLPYAAFGLAVLLPAAFLPRLAVLVLGVAATAWAAGQGGGVILIPGLFLLGAAATEYRPSPRLVVPVFLVSAPLGAALTTLWVLTGGDSRTFVAAVYPMAGLVTAVAYVTGLLILLRTPMRGALIAVLAPLGRMALTNYVLSTPIILLALPLLAADRTRLAGVVLSVVALAAQVAASRWWLARFRYGPLEWVWRCLTWGAWVPNRVDR
ncbi:DUF418 domain-containing protein [Streptosporangium soli]|nr:DUF418 domain-containing protein [Streptosporangium sp. KLBMP 9127]